jgi:hypothetical protein
MRGYTTRVAHARGKTKEEISLIKRYMRVMSLEPMILQQISTGPTAWSGDSGDRTRDLSHPKRESYR